MSEGKKRTKAYISEDLYSRVLNSKYLIKATIKGLNNLLEPAREDLDKLIEETSVESIIKDSMIPNNCNRFYTTFCV